MALSIDVKVLAGDLPQGKQKILLNSIKSAELQTEDKLKKLAGSAGWGFAGALAGGLLTGGIGLAVGGLAGILSGGNKTEVCFSGELEDGQRFLAVTSKKTWQRILAAKFAKDPTQASTQTQLTKKPLIQDQVNSKSRFAIKKPYRLYVYISIATLPGIITGLLYRYEPTSTNLSSESSAIPLSKSEQQMSAHDYTVIKCGDYKDSQNIDSNGKPTKEYWSCYGKFSKEFSAR
jgi:hypothetical protein